MALPTGYTQVEYIETTGTQYIDTGFKPNQNTRVVVDFRASAANRHVFGARTSFPNNSFVLFWVSNASYCIQVNNSTFNGGSFDTSARCTVDMTASAFKINGVTKATYSVSAFQTAYNLYIASCPNSSESENMPGRYYSCQVYDNGRLIRDYVPCKNSSNEAGMYDQANGVFYRNAGSGTFGVGAVVEGGITGGGADPANFTVNARVTVGGVGKKLTNGYVVVDGVLKQLLRAYVYMNGALVSLNMPKPKFTWKKYNVSTVSSYELYQGDTIDVYSGMITAGRNYSFNKDTGAITLIGTLGSTSISLYVNEYTEYPYFTPHFGNYTGQIFKVVSVTVSEDSSYVTGIQLCSRYVTAQVQGSYISDVTAETEKAYPANGIHTDGYWYVKQ